MSGERKPKESRRTSAIDHDLIRNLARLLDETGLTGGTTRAGSWRSCPYGAGTVHPR